MGKKVITALAACLVILCPFMAQNLTGNYTGISVGAGVLIFDGTVGNLNGIGTITMVRPGGHLQVEQRLGRFFSLDLTGMYGQLGANNRTNTSFNNFVTDIQQGDLALTFHFDRIFKKVSITPFIGVGFGIMHYQAYTDLKAADGERYYYWQDGSIMNQPESGPINPSTLQNLHRDYVYESKLDSLNKFNHYPFYIPVSVGFDMKLSSKVKAKITATYCYTNTNQIDGTNSGRNDGYLYTSFSLSYLFGKEPASEEDKRYDNVDFSKIDQTDSDGDGVPDLMDDCPATPKGVKVNAKGCPLDSDGDGIPDYLDKEPHTKKGAMVDNMGVTVTEEIIAQKKKEWEDAISDKAQLVVVKESSGNELGKAIPDEFKVADTNGDGKIQAEEITKVIDGFFSGENNFTVEKINRLIDFFFEQ